MEARTDLWLKNLLDERDGAALYEGLAQLERDPERSRSFRELAEGERRHADVWERKLEKSGAALPPDRPSSRIRVLLWLARRLGTAAVLPLVVETEQGDADKYSAQGGDAVALAEEEKAHERVLARMRGPEASDARALIATRERWHRGSGRAGSIRAAIFGMNDGVVSNLLLVLGVGGAATDARQVLVAGLAGLLGGAFSMAVGEYTSVSSQRDILARQIALERREIEETPEEEAAELALIFKQKGLSTEQASRTAAGILKNPEQALDTLVREELGLDPADLGSPWGAAISSFVMFALGAAVPVLPFLFGRGHGAVAWSAGLAIAALAAMGALVGFLSGAPVWKSVGRPVGLAALAAVVVYGLGRLFGAAIT